MTLTTGAKVLGASGIVAGAGLVTVGAVNANTAANSQPDTEAIHDQLDQVEQAIDARGGSFDSYEAHRALDETDRYRDRWQAAGVTTAVAGAIGAVGGIVGVMSGGRAGSIGRGIGLAAGAVAGTAALVGLHSYLQVPKHDQRFQESIRSELEQAAGDIQPTVSGPTPYPGSVTAPVVPGLPEGPSSPVVDAADSVAAARDAEPIAVDEYATDLQTLDSFNADRPDDSAAFMRRMMAVHGDVAIPETGDVDWNSVVGSLDVDDDGFLASDERAGLRAGGRMAVYVDAAEAFGATLGDPQIARRPGFLDSAINGQLEFIAGGARMRNIAMATLRSIGVDEPSQMTASQLDDVQRHILRLTDEQR